MSLLQTYLKALSYLKDEKAYCAFICLANTFLAVISVVEPILFGRIITCMTKEGASEALIFSIACWISFGICNIIASVFVARGADRFTHRRRLAFLTASFKDIITMPLSWHQEKGTASALHILLSASDMLATLWLEFMRQHLSTIVALLILLPTALTMDYHLTLVLLLLGVSYVLIARFVMTKTEKDQKAVEKSHQLVFQHISDCITNVTTIQSYNRIKEEVKSLKNYTEQLLKAQYPVLNWWALASALNRMASTFSIIIVLVLGAILVSRKELNVGQVVSFIGFAQLMISRLDQISGFINLISNARAKLENFFLLEKSIKATQEDDHLPDLGKIKGSITIKDLSYTFPNGQQALHNISFSLKAGKTLAIVGPTGAGKTTLINLLQRIYEPPAGKIFIDDKDITQVNLSSLRTAFATVFQDGGLLNRSIRENILLAQPNAPEETLCKASKIAAAHDFIIEKTQGYETVVGERGSQLSGGERQRLAIARAILKASPILILDEATSALDVETEMRIKSALENITRNKTTIIIAHRLSTIRNADFVLFMEHGRAVEYGTFSELVQYDGRFNHLLKTAGIIIDEPSSQIFKASI